MVELYFRWWLEVAFELYLVLGCCSWPWHVQWGATRKKVAQKAEHLQWNESKHMLLMCCIEWCSCHGPTQPAQWGRVQVVHFHFQLLLWTFSWWSSTFDGDWKWRSSSTLSLAAAAGPDTYSGAQREKRLRRKRSIRTEMRVSTYIYMTLTTCHADGPVVRLPNQLRSGRCKYRCHLIPTPGVGICSPCQLSDGPFIDEDSHALLEYYWIYLSKRQWHEVMLSYRWWFSRWSPNLWPCCRLTNSFFRPLEAESTWSSGPSIVLWHGFQSSDEVDKI